MATPRLINAEQRTFCKLAVAVGLLAAFALQGCSQTAGESPRIPSPKTTLSIVLASSAELGCVRSGSEPVSRIVEIRNSSNDIIHISRWTVSCECLTVEPASVDADPAKVTYIRLVFDPAKEGEGFAGNLRMSVDGFDDAVRVCTFDVPVSVIAPAELKHLEK